MRFFAEGLEASAQRTHDRMLTLVDVQREMKERVRGSALGAETAQALVDFAVSNILFTVRAVEKELKISYGRANTLVGQLVQLEVIAPLGTTSGGARRFYALQVFNVLLDDDAARQPSLSR